MSPYYANPRLLFFLFVICISSATASPIQTTYHIKVDQFGYLTNSRKVAVIADPQVGYNAAESFIPGTGANQYQVRRWDNDVIVFSGTLQQWGGGATHTQSGDRGWWFDFSALVTPGSYYVFDVVNNVGSFRFEIGDNVYNELLKHVVRMYFYQRINFAKQAPYTDTRWSDGACFEGANQDRYATSRYAKGDISTAKDLHGGWMDAGDKNKYVTFANSAIIQLTEAYRMNPTVFKDDYNIPESGNGIPDVLDEVMYELDFLKRMQDASGTNGFFLKVGVDNYNEITPPSADTRPRYYLPECTSSTLSGCSMFAVAGTTIKNVPALSVYGQDLINRAELAWARAKVTTNNFTTYQINCDDGDIKASDADNTADEQLANAFVASVYLYEATGKAEYKSFAETNYVNVYPYKISWWGPYWIAQQMALLRLTTLPDISATVVNNIRNQKAGMNYLYSINDYNAGTDLYRAYLGDDTYHWNHNQVRTTAGCQNMDYITFNINSANHSLYKEVAEQYLHSMNGVNPMGFVMLSNMYNYGAEKCANEIYHTWFRDGSSWDNALASANGPAPGYVPGGPNKNYSGSVSGISTQPPQKAYKDWNTEYPENSWEITEPAIYTQASYVMLLARLMPENTTVPPTDSVAPTTPTNLAITNITESSLTLNWTASTDNVGVAAYEVYQNAALINPNVTSTTYNVSGLNCATNYSFTVKAKDAAGNISEPSNTASATTLNCTVLTTNIVYADVIGIDWQDVSSASTRNFNNTTPVKTGAKSIRVDYQANGTLAFQKGSAAITSLGTELRFWVYNTGNNTIKIFTASADNGGVSTMVTTRPARKRWVEVVVNMSALGNPTAIKKITIQNNSTQATTMYFDEIRLTNIVETALTARNTSDYSDNVNTDSGDADIIVFPNPVSGQSINVQLQNMNAEMYTIKLYNSFGQLIASKDINHPGGSITYVLTLPANIIKGTYHLEIVNSNRRRSYRLIAQ
ncbi:MAG TPA: glycoside hydrolase family 9 protein [Chitinophagaceae bacterium]|nr:glycoside hydrolase family 9 protein [Chitinophagaceae bacterium]